MCCVLLVEEVHKGDELLISLRLPVLDICRLSPIFDSLPFVLLLKPCPHCRGKVRLSQKTARQRRQSHFSATVWTGFKTPSASALIVLLSPSPAAHIQRCAFPCGSVPRRTETCGAVLSATPDSVTFHH